MYHSWQLLLQQLSQKNQSLGMFGLRSSRNLLAPPMLIRAGNPEVRAPWCHPWVIRVLAGSDFWGAPEVKVKAVLTEG